jgi:PAS domain S-box-containing protein
MRDHSGDAIIGTSLDGTITTWNHAAEVIFGYRPEEVIGQSVFVLAAPGREDEMPLILDRIREGQRITHYETARRHKVGNFELRNFELSFYPLARARGRCFPVSAASRRTSVSHPRRRIS